ncbi:MAG: hypothetical protein FJZ13_04145 [Candidatus Omnitrophica bacterium]|nr:hypothetical protein [Candidatus Omnitrophota bacterium]
MGITHKLNPEIKSWILEKKRDNPRLSCRGLASLAEENFKVKVSKSSINWLFKEAGLSLPVGRRQEKIKPAAPAVTAQPVLELPVVTPQVSLPMPTPSPTPVEAPTQIQPELPLETPIPIFSSGIILLKAMDYLIGGTYYIQETIKRRQRLSDKNLLDKIEYLLYAPLLEMPQEPANAYLKELEGAEPIARDILRALYGILTEVRHLKIVFSEGDTAYLDAQMHTLWSVPNIPFDFINSIYNAKDYINKTFYKNSPLVLFMAPGYDTPTAEFFNFILGLEGRAKKITDLVLCGNKLEEIERFYLERNRNCPLIFGMWPWQFTEYRRVKKIGEFKPFSLRTQARDFYIAEIELELSASDKSQSVSLYGCTLKTNLAEKIRLVILSNMPAGTTTPECLAKAYLSRWPNLEETLQDFNRKVELFTYTADSQPSFLLESLKLKQTASELRQLLDNYLGLLDLYMKRFFLPPAYEKKDFSILKEEFYALKADFRPQEEYGLITFHPTQGFTHLKALEYACRRLNEREITLSDGKRLWFGA